MTRTHKTTILLALLTLAAILPSCTSADTKPFTVVMLPDTQHYSAQFPNIFHDQTKWIRNNISREHIVFVTQVGDIVDNGGVPAQWKNADAAMARLDGVVPYGVAIGNHDYDDLGKQSSPSFARHFGPKRFAGRPWYIGGTKDGQCSAQTFTGAGRQFMILHLPFEPDDKAIAWAETVLAAHPGIPTIISTHSYLSPPQGNPNPFGNNELPRHNGAKAIKAKLVDKHPQIFLVLCGHLSTDVPVYRTDANHAGGAVLSFLADFQGGQWGGNGYLVLLKFDPASNNIIIRVYSPHLKQDLPGPQGNFTLPCPIPLAEPSTARPTPNTPEAAAK